MIQGSSHPRTARSATGQDTCGRIPWLSLIFFPRCRCSSRNVSVWKPFWISWLQQLVRRAGRGVARMIPAEGEGAAHELPMPPDGLVAAHLVLRPAERMFDVFVALLDPGAQPVEPDHLFQTGWREWRFASHAFGWGRDVCDQIPGGEIGQRLWVGGGYHSAFLLLWPIRPSHDLYRPPILRTTITKRPGVPDPLTRLLRPHPSSL